MKIVEKIENGPVLICPDIFEDERGYFYESFNEQEFKNKVCDTTFVQDNQSLSSYGVLRGMHFQTGDFVQAKLVRVGKGAVIDVEVDIREDSQNKGEVCSYLLSEDNHYQLFVPRGFAHGFLTIKDGTVFQYKCDNYYSKTSEGSFNYNSFGFNWTKYVPENKIIVSEKDAAAAPFDIVQSSRKIVEIPKETISQIVENVTNEEIARSITDASASIGETKFPYEVYVDVISDGVKQTARLTGLSPLIYEPVSFKPTRRIMCEDINSGMNFALTRAMTEVIRFYKFA